ncbi:Gfo/Idh/MocA family oxidoreductase [Candidatus Woesearchaeota archaeon]|nr:Gfo/Idh/MocA family oxidoreductase [Candidatus Woesearchaeota archaeon]
MTLNVGIIGCGNIASLYSNDFSRWPVTHLAAYTDHPMTKVVAVCDTDPSRARSCAERWDIPKWYASYVEMLQQEKCDIISICTSYESHAEIIREIARYRVRAILCEKPFTHNLDDAREVTDLCKKKGISLAVNFQRRHDRLHEYVKENLSSLVGDVKKVTFLYSGGIINNGSHAFDLLRFYFGEISSLSSIVEDGTSDGSFAMDPNLTVHLRFTSGLSVVLTSCTIPNHSTFEMSILGTKARLDLLNKPFFGYDYRYFPYVSSETLPSVTCSSSVLKHTLPNDFSRDLLVRAIDNLIQSIENNDPHFELVSSAENGISALELVSAAIFSARTHQEITFPFTQSLTLPRLQGVFTTWKRN